MNPRNEVSVYVPIGRAAHDLEAASLAAIIYWYCMTHIYALDSRGLLAVFFDFLLPEGAASQFIELEFPQFFCSDNDGSIPGFRK